MNYTRTPRNIVSRQAGMLSIMVTMLLMIVVSLIVLGFAQVSRREQRQSLDRQLSTQAYLAAESGINDAKQRVNSYAAGGGDIPEKTDCATTPSDSEYPLDPVIDSNNKVSYSCLLITSKLNSLASSVSVGGDPVVLPLETDGANINSLTIKWKATSTPTSVSGCGTAGSYPKSGSGGWSCPFGVLRMDIVPTTTLSRAAMAAGQHTMFLYPTTGGGSVAYGATNGASPAMKCTTAGCAITISGVGGSKFAIKMAALYVSGSFTITGVDAGGAAVIFKNAQVQIDSTGKAQDVLRRVQVRLPINGVAQVPQNAINSASSICKRFQYSDDNGFEIPSTITGQDANNPMCDTF